MLKIIKYIILTLAVIAFPFLSEASEGGKVVSECWKKTESHVDAVDCAHKVLKEKEKQLEQVYSEVLKKGKTLDEEMKAMGSALSNIEKPTIQSQKDFEQYMESECERQVSLVMGGTAGADIAISCKINLINERIKSLKPNFFEELNSLSKDKIKELFNDDYTKLNFPLNLKLDNNLYLISYRHPSHLSKGLYIVDESKNTKERISYHYDILKTSTPYSPLKYYVLRSSGSKSGILNDSISIVVIGYYKIYEKIIHESSFIPVNQGCGNELHQLENLTKFLNLNIKNLDDESDELTYKQRKTDCKTREQEILEQKVLINRKSIENWNLIYEW